MRIARSTEENIADFYVKLKIVLCYFPIDHVGVDDFLYGMHGVVELDEFYELKEGGGLY